MRIYQYSSGLILDEQFNSLGPEWSSTDPANTTIENGSLQLTHSFLRDVSFLREIPAGAGAFEAVVNYTPTAVNDRAGLILFKSSIETAELLESEDANQSKLENIKVIKNDDVFDLYMKRNGSFEFIDSATYSFSKIGFVVKQGSGSGFVPFRVDQFIITKNDRLEVVNLYEGFKVELTIDSTLLRATADITGKVTFALPHLITSGTLKIYDQQSNLIGEITTEFVGGDVYYYGSFLELRKDGVSLSDLNPNDIGNIATGKLEEKLEVYNPTATELDDVKIQVKQYSGDNGYQWIDVAPDIYGTPGSYSDMLTIENLPGQTSSFFWIKVEKQEEIMDEEIFFSIEIDH
ncbi:hypothetical protein K7T73_15365 [Bacillus badius]|uniref:hypothetical protein n=1 Tax=Bacillus badius TaxID=1455 RepID=UPI001CBD1B21|nr:hypothetical protein [Bacillus badius]UAT29926.1 hypothetical protein K7T73_15365 [Bacillus badius]